MDNQTSSQNNRLTVLIIILIVSLVGAGFLYFFNHKSTTKTTPEVKPFAVEKKDLGPNQIPQGFPKDLPSEPGSVVIQNYEATTTDGRHQSTRIITTTKTLSGALKIYQDFFLALGWTAIPTSSEPNSANALFRKKDDALFITAHSDATGKQKTIELTLTEAKK